MGQQCNGRGVCFRLNATLATACKKRYCFYLVFVRFDFIPLFRNRAQAVTGIGQQNRSTDFQPLWRGGFCMVFHCLRNAHCMALRITENVPKLSTAFLRQPWPIEELCRSSPQCTIFGDFCDRLKAIWKKMKLWHSFGQNNFWWLMFWKTWTLKISPKFDVVGIFVCSDSWFFGARSKGLEIKLIAFQLSPGWTSGGHQQWSFLSMAYEPWRGIIRYRGDLSRFMPFGLLWAYLDRAKRENALVFSVQRFVSAGVALRFEWQLDYTFVLFVWFGPRSELIDFLPPTFGSFRTLSMAAYAIIGVQQLQQGVDSCGALPPDLVWAWFQMNWFFQRMSDVILFLPQKIQRVVVHGVSAFPFHF